MTVGMVVLAAASAGFLGAAVGVKLGVRVGAARGRASARRDASCRRPVSSTPAHADPLPGAGVDPYPCARCERLFAELLAEKGGDAA